jgi:hypothetical protein
VVEIYPVTAKHEDILSNTALLKKGTVLDDFLKALIATPGVSLSDFLIGDKNALFVAARISAYGEEYVVPIKCPSCGVTQSETINLSAIQEKQNTKPTALGENKCVFTLPSSGKTVAWKMLTHKEETDIDAEIKALTKLGVGTSSEITTRLKYAIVMVNGEQDKAKIKQFIDTELSAKDSLALRRHIREVTPDLDMTFMFECKECGHQEKMTVPLGASFFWPNINDQ